MNPSTPSPALLQLIRSLEISLHQPSVRIDRAQLDKLLHTDFVELGRSGQRYTKAGALELLLLESTHSVIWSQDFELALPAYSVALLTYKSAHIDEHSELSRHALRSSLWQYAEAGWQLRFHQATPTEAFAKDRDLTAPLAETRTP
jgi:hypothetical protein